MQTRNRGDYTIAGCELVAEGADLRVQVLSLAAGQCVPWHYHSEISDSFVCLEGPVVVEARRRGLDAPANRTKSATSHPWCPLHCDWLDQARVLVLDAAHACADRPARHLVRRVGREHGLELARIGWLLSKPSRPGLAAEDRLHPVVKLGAQGVRLRWHAGEAPVPIRRQGAGTGY